MTFTSATLTPILSEMGEIQDKLNGKVHPEWWSQYFYWPLAINKEASELHDHLNWKWWKEPAPVDINQVQMEVVDLLHFVLSFAIEQHRSEFLSQEEWEELPWQNYATTLLLGYEARVTHYSEDYELLQQEVLELMRASLNDEWEIDDFLYSLGCLCALSGLSIEDLCKKYIGKAKLNELRWANGYGTTYIKMWRGKEDNVHLTCILDQLDINSPDFSAKVESGLKLLYEMIKLDHNN